MSVSGPVHTRHTHWHCTLLFNDQGLLRITKLPQASSWEFQIRLDQRQIKKGEGCMLGMSRIVMHVDNHQWQLICM